MDTTTLDDRTQARRGKRRRALLAILLSSSLATLGAGAMSLAIFTDDATAQGAWSTGSIILDVQPVTAFSATDILPGDSGEQDVAVENNGTGELRYDMVVQNVVDADGLLDVLNVTVLDGTCAAPGATIFTGAMSGAALNDIVVPASGQDDLCFQWDLPLATGNAYQTVSATADFFFTAEQTAHNP
jgi:hypothetical protein